ncbi:MAG: hypothetical protein GY820_21680 [Gammaproteobacteria bacterium]|nr:hypothetical protein [Gammaproteobacteria bacterium]
MNRLTSTSGDRQLTLRLMNHTGENVQGPLWFAPVNSITVRSIRNKFNIPDDDAIFLRGGKCYFGSDDLGRFVIPDSST